MQQFFIQFINYIWYLLHALALDCHPQGAFLVSSERCSIEEQSIEYCEWTCCIYWLGASRSDIATHHATMLFHLIYTLVVLKICSNATKTIQYNFLNRLAQIRERGIQDRIHKQYVLPKEPGEEPSTIDISMVTIAPILVVLAAGYVIVIFVLVIERCVHGNILKCWSRGSVRRWR
jgi:hypothetical protein